jgi:hypothetical protein
VVDVTSGRENEMFLRHRAPPNLEFRASVPPDVILNEVKDLSRVERPHNVRGVFKAPTVRSLASLGMTTLLNAFKESPHMHCGLFQSRDHPVAEELCAHRA